MRLTNASSSREGGVISPAELYNATTLAIGDEFRMNSPRTSENSSSTHFVTKGEKRSYFRRRSRGCPYQYHTNTAPSPTALTAAATRPNRTSVIKKMAPIIARARKANPPSYGREPLREGHDKQEGEEHLHPWESHPQLVEQFDDLAVAALLFVFTVPLLLLFTAHLSNILRHRFSLHPFEGLR